MQVRGEEQGSRVDTLSSELPESAPAAIIEQFLVSLRTGKQVDVQEFCKQYPDSSDDLRPLLAAAAWLERCRPDAALEVGGRMRWEQAAPPSRLGEFRIAREIGRGAMGVVYDAVQESLGRRVALKVLAPRDKPSSVMKERFRREAEIASRLHHTNIVPVYGAGEADDQLFYAMQFIEGRSLFEWLRGQPAASTAPQTTRVESGPTEIISFSPEPKATASPSPEPNTTASPDIRRLSERAGECPHHGRQRLPDPSGEQSGDDDLAETAVGLAEPGKGHHPSIKDVARIGQEIAQALQHAHEQRILHRDIKPSNILIDRQGRAWVTDFGLAKPTESPDLTNAGDIVGTLRYMAPERFRGACDARSDVYGLGATLYEALLGRPVIAGTDHASLLAEVSKAREIQIPASEMAIPADLRTIVNKAIRFAPEDRYPSAAALADDLCRFVENRPITARRASTMRRVTLWAHRNPWLAGVSATLVSVIVAALLGLGSLWQRSELLRDQAETHLSESQENLRLAIAAVDQFCDRVSDDPRLLEHDLRPLRQQLLTTAVDFHRQLLSRRGKSRNSRIDLARAYSRLGRLSSEIDSHDQTREYLQQATEAYAELYREEPRNAGLRREYAQSIADLAVRTDSTGDADDAERHYLQAMELLGGAPTSDNDTLLRQAKLLLRYGVFLRRHVRLREAEGPIRDGLAILESLHTQNPSVDTYRSELAKGLMELGELYQSIDLKRWRESEASYHRALAIQKPLLSRDEVQSEWRALEAKARHHLAHIFRISGRDAEAEKAYGQSISILRQLVEDHSSVTDYHAALAGALNGLGEILGGNGEYERAEPYWRESREIWRRLTAEDPSNLEFVVYLGEAEMNTGELAVHSANDAVALSSFSRAIEILQGVLRETPNQSRAQFLLTASLERRATLYQEQREFQKAAQDWEIAAVFSKPFMRPWCQAQGAICVAKAGDHVRAASLANDFTASSSSTAKGHGQYRFAAARALAIAAQAARNDDQLTPSDRNSFADRYAHEAAGILAGLLKDETVQLDDLWSVEEFAALKDDDAFRMILTSTPSGTGAAN